MLILYLGVLSSLAFAQPQDQSSDEKIEDVLANLETKFSGIKTLQSNFFQEKSLSMFDQKIILEGKLYFQKPELLAWHVIKPVRYSSIIKKDTILQWDEETGQVQQISLKNNPIFGAALEQMKAWFLGAYTNLLNDYDISVAAQSPFTLVFVPRSSTAAYSIIKQVSVVFNEDQRYIHQILIEENDKDSSLLTFVDTQLNRPIDHRAWEVKRRVQ